MSYRFGATVNKNVSIMDDRNEKVNISKGTRVFIKDDNYKSCHHPTLLVKYGNHNFIHIRQEDLNFDIPKRLYIVSNSEDGTADISGEYMLIGEEGKILYQETCSAKKFAKKDLIIGHTERLKTCSMSYGGNFKILHLGEDEMTAQMLLDAYWDYFSKN